jgi:hypothetical protein
MGNEQDDITFCDNCGEITTDATRVVYTRLPFAVSSANAGESAVICIECEKQRTRVMLDIDTPLL